MVERNRLLSLSFYEKSPFTGSDGLLRYRIEKTETDGKKQLLASAWFGEFAFDHTPDEDKSTHTSDFSEEGLSALCDWLNEIKRN